MRAHAALLAWIGAKRMAVAKMAPTDGGYPMLQNPPAEPGMREEDIDTPALVI